MTDGSTCQCGRYLEPGKRLHRNGTDCPYRKTCTHTEHPRELGVVTKRNGIIARKTRCSGCGGQRGDADALQASTMPTVWTENHTSGVQCSVKSCTRTDVEDHHFAPRNTFPDAEDWPIMPLCRHHHNVWHSVMNGYRRTARTDHGDTRT